MQQGSHGRAVQFTVDRVHGAESSHSVVRMQRAIREVRVRCQLQRPLLAACFFMEGPLPNDVTDSQNGVIEWRTSIKNVALWRVFQIHTVRILGLQ